MKVSEFNQQYAGKFNIRHAPARRVPFRILLDEYCPSIQRFVTCLRGRCGWDLGDGSSFEDGTVPPDILEVMVSEAVILHRSEYSDDVYAASSTEEIGLVSLHLLEIRKEQIECWWMSDREVPKPPDQKVEDFPTNPDLQKFLKQQWDSHNNRMKDYEAYVDMKATYLAAKGLLPTMVGIPNFGKAWRLVQDKDFFGDAVSLLPLERVKPPTSEAS